MENSLVKHQYMSLGDRKTERKFADPQITTRGEGNILGIPSKQVKPVVK